MNIVKRKLKSAKGTEYKEHTEDLTQYVDDHAELIHQAFKCVEPQLLQDLLPYTMKHFSNSKVQQMCVEEMLDMTSKGLCSIMDGVKPTREIKCFSSGVSLDSISSDEMQLDVAAIPEAATAKVKIERNKSKKKKRHRKKSKKASPREDRNLLDLVELEARARAIRAQLNKHQDNT